jgi:hypothetical protein
VLEVNSGKRWSFMEWFHTACAKRDEVYDNKVVDACAVTIDARIRDYCQLATILWHA